MKGRNVLGGTGRYESTVGEIVDKTEPRFHFDDGFTVPSRPVVTVNTAPSKIHVTPSKFRTRTTAPFNVSFFPGAFSYEYSKLTGACLARHEGLDYGYE